MADARYDIVIKNGTVFDGRGNPGRRLNVGIRDGEVVTLTELPLSEAGAEVIDAQDQWVMPGMLDMHTHYDAELVAAPALRESVKHGVTTVAVGSCSISMILSEPEDCSDLFTRVESVPREKVLPLLQQAKTWDSAAGYVDFLKRHPLGPNVAAFLGHSDLRVRTMGLSRSVQPGLRPEPAEMKAMEGHLEEALDAGMMGLSGMTNPWDKLDGDRERSASLPSSYAPWWELRRLNRILRRRDKVLQSAPNLVTKYNALLFGITSAGWFFRKKLKTTLITLMAVKGQESLPRLAGFLANFFNRFFRADFRWESLPTQFEVFSDGIDLVIFEEFGAGEAVLHLVDELQRNELMRDPEYRKRFRKDYEKRFGARVWHRDLGDTNIVEAPDASLVGKSFADVAAERGVHEVDAFLDLVVEHGRKLRWHTVIGNYRPEQVRYIVNQPCTLLAFNDSGAHIRNMAFYNSQLRFLKQVRDSAAAGDPVMPLEKAIWKLSGELADWFDLDAGHLEAGARADIAVINPEGLGEQLSEFGEADIENLDLKRLVNRSDHAVTATIINGRTAFRQGRFAPELGQQIGFGTFLPAGARGVRAATPATPAEQAPDAARA
jgi:N-acyl-D-glutamate deacylase